MEPKKKREGPWSQRGVGELHRVGETIIGKGGKSWPRRVATLGRRGKKRSVKGFIFCRNRGIEEVKKKLKKNERKKKDDGAIIQGKTSYGKNGRSARVYRREGDIERNSSSSNVVQKARCLCKQGEIGKKRLQNEERLTTWEKGTGGQVI